ncbi:MAG TPA: hypothetical protein VIR79_03600 [Nitrospira sp.]
MKTFSLNVRLEPSNKKAEGRKSQFITKAFPVGICLMKGDRMRHHRLERYSIAALTIVVFGWNVNSWSAEPVTPIGFLLSNPSAYHRKALRLEGIAKEVAAYSGHEVAAHRPLCGVDFKLVDNTGVIEIFYHVRCAAGEERASHVVEGAHVIVEGSMEAPPSTQRTLDGKQLEFGVFANSVTSVAR